MLGFFNTLDDYSKFYFIIAIISTVSFLIKLLLMFTGVDDTTDTDELNVEASFTLLSVQSVLSFLMGVGWIGLAASTDWGLGKLSSSIFAAMAGFFAMCLMSFLMMQVKRLNSTPTFNANEYVGKSGKAYTKFEPKGNGQIQIEVGGKLRTLKALNGTEEEIPSFVHVIVTEVSDNTVLISKK